MNAPTTICLAALVALPMDGQPNAEPRLPSARELLAVVEGYGHAIETNNRELALWYVHPDAFARASLDDSLREQLELYMERVRTSRIVPEYSPDGMVEAQVDQEFVRVFGMKFTRGSRRSIFRFRSDGNVWRIWEINEVIGNR